MQFAPKINPKKSQKARKMPISQSFEKVYGAQFRYVAGVSCSAACNLQQGWQDAISELINIDFQTEIFLKIVLDKLYKNKYLQSELYLILHLAFALHKYATVRKLLLDMTWAVNCIENVL